MNQIKICMGSSCFIRGNNRNLDTLKRLLANGKINAEIEIVGALCEEKCSKGPVLIINGIEFPKALPETLNTLLIHSLNEEILQK